MRLILIACLAFTTFIAQAQKGTIRGTVYEEATGESIVGATVMVKGTSKGAYTDLDGKFTFQVEPGSYTLQVSYISFQALIVEDVIVKADEVTTLPNVQLSQSSQQLEAAVVTAEAVTRSEQALLTEKRKSVTMMDGISAEKMQLTGDATAVEAAKRVTGVSIEGGKYVYIRGLGDRYSKTTLNGVDVPGLDPDKNTLQMDIFPTSLINNITVNKNFTADQPADFTGGIMNIETKGFPDAKFFDVSAGLSYNPGMHFNSDYLTSDGGDLDFLGFDDGTRELPVSAGNSNIPTPLGDYSDRTVNNFVSSFNPTLGAQRETSLMDYSASISFGDQIDLNRFVDSTDQSAHIPKLGYTFSLSYKNEYKYYDDVVYSEYQRYKDPDISELRYSTIREGELGERNVLWGALGGLAYKTQYSKYKLTAMRVQNGESTAGMFNIDNDGSAVGQSGYFGKSDVLTYHERSMTNVLLHGTHYKEATGWEVDWRISPTWSTSEDPDLRKTAFTYSPVDTLFMAGAAGNPTRIWRSLEEVNATAKIDFTKEHTLFTRDAKLKFGASHTYKQRDYNLLQFNVQFWQNQSWPNPDPSEVLDPDNIFPNSPNGIYYQSGNSTPNPNAYKSNVHNTGVYVSQEFKPVSGLNAILGVRMENFVQRHTGRDQNWARDNFIDGHNLENDKVLESRDFFPSAILIYELNEMQNLRGSFSQTIARPSFKELSYAQILDPITNRTFNGGLWKFEEDGWDGNLTETRINNYDIRWELFQKDGQIFSVSAFYKQFDDPIELVRIPINPTSEEYQPRNVGDGELFGAEVEVRKKLSFISERLSNFHVSTNLTFVESRIQMTDTEFDARKAFEKIGQDIDDVRAMAGQAPYVINAGIGYDNHDLGIDAGIFYNVKGPTLHIVGTGLFPDIYQEPFHSLNFGINKKMGEDQNTSIDFKISNILNDRREIFYHAYEAESQIFSSLNPGISISLGISHRF